MKRVLLACVACFVCLTTIPVTGQRYAVQRDGDVVHLVDTGTDTRVSIAPSIGNIAFRMIVKGHDILRWPHADMAGFKSNPNMTGIPFMGPWINRLDEQAFYANGKRYAFDMSLGNVRGTIPIHGFLTGTSEWRVVSVDATAAYATVASRLEFYRQPSWMKQWPFAHTVHMSYTLSNGALVVETFLENMSTEPMPVSIGFHPYFQLTDSRRDDWTIGLDARRHWKLGADKLPTGETEPVEQLFPNPQAIALRDVDLDDVFSEAPRSATGRTSLWVKGKSQQITVEFGPRYRAAVIWAPKGREFICFEPMAAITNGLNLAHKGTYKELQSIPPGRTWSETFSISAQGF
jgi:aldose 1-epimerase